MEEETEKENLTCKELAVQLGKLPMHIGRVRNEVCTKEDLAGTQIRPSGVLKILAHYNKEMEIVETGNPEIVKVEAIAQRLANPRWLLAFDRGRRQKVKVSVPKNRKAQLSKAKTHLIVERGCQDGRYFYQWKPNLKL